MGESWVFNASSLPLLERHPAMWGFEREANAPRGDSEPAALGRAYHHCLELAAANGRDSVNLRTVAREFNVRLADLETLWRKLDWDPHGYSAEVPVTITRPFEDGIIEIRIVVDLVRLIGESTFEVVEVKTGTPSRATDAAEHAQLIAEMVGIHRNYGRDVGLGYALWVQVGERGWTDCEVRGEEAWQKAEDWIFGICERALLESRKEVNARQCRVGDGCSWCQGAHRCPVFMKPVRDTLAIVEKGDPLVVTDENAETLYAVKRFADAAQQRIGEVLNAFVRTNGEVALADGRVLRAKEQERMEQLGAKHIRAALKSREVSDDDIARLIDEVDAQRVKNKHWDVRPVGKKDKGDA